MATTSPMTTPNMGLSLSMMAPIDVAETTSNLEEIQSFPVVRTALDGTHFHQDPTTGQMYRMTSDLHDRIPQILASRMSSQMGTVSPTYGSSGGTMGGGTTSQPTVVSPIVNTQTQESMTNPYMELAMEKYKNIQSLSTFNKTASDFVKSPPVPFTQAVNSIQQTYYGPEQQLYGQSNQPIFDYTNSKTEIINVLTNKFMNMNVSEEFQLNLPEVSSTVNRIFNQNFLYSNVDLNSTQFIPINKFYNTVSII